MGRLAGKISIVTGAGRGIGHAIATRFGAEGAVVVAANRNEAEGEAVAAEIAAAGGEAEFIRTDIRRLEDCERLVSEVESRHGRIDVLCNNAGVGLLLSVEDTSLDDYDYIMDTNVRGAFWLTKHAVGGMVKRGSGSIINLASVASFVGFENDAAYCASKGALLMLTRQVALEYAAEGVRVNAICPGLHRDAGDAPLLRAAGRSRSSARCLPRRPPHGPGRPAHRGRRRGGLPGLRRVVVRDRRLARRGRWSADPLTVRTAAGRRGARRACR